MHTTTKTIYYENCLHQKMEGRKKTVTKTKKLKNYLKNLCSKFQNSIGKVLRASKLKKIIDSYRADKKDRRVHKKSSTLVVHMNQ